MRQNLFIKLVNTFYLKSKIASERRIEKVTAGALGDDLWDA